MYDSVHEVAEALPQKQLQKRRIKVSLGGEVERINLSLKMPPQRTPTGSFTHSRNASKSGSMSPNNRSKMHTGQQTSDAKVILYPNGDRVSDQV